MQALARPTWRLVLEPISYRCDAILSVVSWSSHQLSVRRRTMALYTHRVQAVLTEAQFQELTKVAEAAGRPVSVMIREAVETTYLRDVAERRRRAALEQLLSLDAPVSDWGQMEG